jgi:hypothetical protein
MIILFVAAFAAGVILVKEGLLILAWIFDFDY